MSRHDVQPRFGSWTPTHTDQTTKQTPQGVRNLPENERMSPENQWLVQMYSLYWNSPFLGDEFVRFQWVY